MRLPKTAHTSRPWRIHEIARDFRLEDVWQLRWHGEPDDFPRLLEMLASGHPAQGSPAPVRALFAIREKLGGLLGLDDPDSGVDSRVPSLRDRLPADLEDAPRPEFEAMPFSSLYLLEDEFAAEVANRTVHGVLHLGRVPDEDGRGVRAHMAILVKPNGVLGEAYMAAIKPFRHLVVYPALLRQWEQAWERRAVSVPSSPGP